ncbi:hypothetical protein LO763_13345 [Glycomyces sp. A-F 0318]|uniref:hypothetical protein n=1 Tax=Glycomyces amatae TaxID=2881355 RepID=UPI001E39F70D|nr:hypothetical protein [Glycomyces amatae]MCD0444607.1 hypothetical protein [Glycomyces amatae]
MNSTTGRLLLVGAVSAALLTTAAPAQAQEDEAGYASWTFEGGSRDYTGTMTLPGNFPEAVFTSDARADSGLRSGGNTWLGEDTPFGEVFGSSRDQGYPLIRPDTDAPGNPSTTTYAFASPTPSSGWGFALGDLDADTVTVRAADAEGNPVPAAGLGFEGVFNYCTVSPRPGACSGGTGPDSPTSRIESASVTITGAGADDNGDAAWFRPTAPLAGLTFEFSALSGLPVYQTWFAKLAIPEPEPGEDPADEPGEDPLDAAAPVADDASGDAPSDGEGPLGLPVLPVTGAPLAAAGGAGLAALAAGAAALAWTRRRSRA